MASAPISILSPAESAAWDRQAEGAGIPLARLMDAAGRAAAHVIAARFIDRLRSGVLIAAGPGNNGGDGWVIARALHRVGLPVFVAPVGMPPKEPAREAAERARAEGVRVVEADGPWPTIGLAVDALLGTGASGPLRSGIGAMVDRVNELEVPVVAVDGPTGVDLATGATHGASIRPALSVTFGALRRGHLLAREESGDVIVVDIGHPPLPDPVPGLVTDGLAAGWIPAFRADDHKGRRGRVIVIGGNAGMTGAVRLASRAAFAAGAGLVHAVAPAETVSALVQAEPDLQTMAQDFEQPPSAALLALLAGADSVVIGPGLGRAPGRADFVAAIISASSRVVLDADGLNAFQDAVPRLAELSRGRDLVLTPHPGEFRRLFPSHGADLEHDPWGAASRAAGEGSWTIVLKGAPSVVTWSGGSSWTVAAGNPGLATGGSGDVLSGIIGCLMGQGLETPLAAAAGCQGLGRAADFAARRVTARSLRPMDVIQSLPDVWRAWGTLRQLPAPARPPILFELEAPIRW